MSPLLTKPTEVQFDDFRKLPVAVDIPPSRLTEVGLAVTEIHVIHAGRFGVCDAVSKYSVVDVVPQVSEVPTEDTRKLPSSQTPPPQSDRYAVAWPVVPLG